MTLTPCITLPAQQVTPLVKHKIVKKRTAKFKRFQSDRKVTVKVRVESGKSTSGSGTVACTRPRTDLRAALSAARVFRGIVCAVIGRNGTCWLHALSRRRVRNRLSTARAGLRPRRASCSETRVLGFFHPAHLTGTRADLAPPDSPLAITGVLEEAPWY